MTTVDPSSNIVMSSDFYELGIGSTNHLTPEGMMIYIQTRLGSLDEQIDEIFKKQEQLEKVRDHIAVVTNILSGAKEGEAYTLSAEQVSNLELELAKLQQTDPGMFAQLVSELESNGFPITLETVVDTGGIETGVQARLIRTNEDAGTVNLKPEEVSQFNSILDHTMSRIESSAQLEMIQLQSLMSQRQTAIQLATNIISALGKTNESIVGNVGR